LEREAKMLPKAFSFVFRLIEPMMQIAVTGPRLRKRRRAALSEIAEVIGL
jgi:hypothetical protein